MRETRLFRLRDVLSFLITTMLLAMTGCSGGGGDSGGVAWWDGGGGTSQAYAVSGTLRDTITSTPVQGATCTLLQTKGGSFIDYLMRIPKETVTVSATTTGTDGTYRFTGILPGTYTLKFTKTDYVTLEVADLSVTGDTSNLDKTVLQTSQWNQVAGPDAPYDATKDYAIVDASIPSKGARGTSGIVAAITPSTGVKIGYFTDTTPATIDWNATGTYSNGRIIFYGLTPGTKYTITFALAGYTFPALSVSSPAGGGIVQSYNIYATAPTPTPTSSPTASPTPTPTPTPSPTYSPIPTPSPGGGGGGGGGSVTPSIASLTPDNGYAGSAVVINGSNFGAAQGNGKVTFFDGKEATIASGGWSATQITCYVPGGATTGNVTVTTSVGSGAKNFTVNADPINVTWTETATGLEQGDHINRIFFTDADHGWLACENGRIYYTINGGTAWNSKLTDGKQWKSVFFLDNNKGFAITPNDAVYSTAGGGVLWASTTGPSIPTPTSVQFFDTLNGYAAGYQHLWRASSNGQGIQWAPKNANEINIDDIYFTDPNNGLVSGNEGANAVIYKTTDGGTENWTKLYDTGAGHFYKMCFPSGTYGWAAGTNGGGDGTPLIANTTDGVNWTAQQCPALKGLYCIHFPKDNICYGWAGGFGGVIVRTTDGGNTWNNVDSSPSASQITSIFFTSVTTGWVSDSNGKLWKITLAVQ